MLIREIRLENLLSFGPGSPPLPLRPLNVLIGPNGAGKSNLIEAIGLLQSAPGDLASPVREGGGIRDWLWKGQPSATATVEAVVQIPASTLQLRHVLSFTESGQRFELTGEQIDTDAVLGPHVYYSNQRGRPAMIVGGGAEKSLPRERVDLERSILAQRRDPEQYPEITLLAEQYERIRIYREWSFGRYTPPRQPQRADQRNDFLAEDFTNLGLVLNRLRRDPAVKANLLDLLNKLYPEIDDFDVSVEGGTVQVFLQEGAFTIPATRLSDGTLRYLCLLAVLCHPQPPPLICLEEPELGLHPDALPPLCDAMKEASSRTQLVVTTHSEAIVDALSASPEDVIVCERHDGQTVMRRLESDALEDWLAHYALGQLWRRGELGGNRW